MIYRCLVCSSLSFEIICKSCKELLKSDVRLKDEVVSFCNYDEIEFLLKFKYHKRGDLVFKFLSKPLSVFANSLDLKDTYIIPIDDNIKKGFSHTAVLAKAMKTKNLKPLYSSLIATSSVKYAGKSLEFRLKNPRNFKYFGKRNINAILVDDVKTTGSTLNEAKELLKKYNVNVIFSVVLSDKSIR